MEKAPENENLIDTEEGVVLAKEVLDYPAIVDSVEDEDLKNRILEVENISDPNNKILTLLELSKESKKQGYQELGSILNKKAIEIDNENNESFERKTDERLQIVRDHIDNFRGFGNKDIDIQEPKSRDYVVQDNIEKVSVKKSTRKKLISTLGRMFGF